MKTPASSFRLALVVALAGLGPLAASAQTASRLTNLSVRARAGTDAQTLILGFTLAGAPDKACLLRAIGPSLAQFGVIDALADPSLLLVENGVVMRANDNWVVGLDGRSLIEQHQNVFALVGAFPLDPSAKDAAFIKSLTAKSYTAHVGGATSPGIALFEIYDAFPDSGARLVNLSGRAQVGPGNDVLIAGFAISGRTSKTVLIRGVGPGLVSQGLTGTLADPKLDLYRGATLIATNDDWSGAAALKDAFTATGAFALPGDASRDAAMVVTLAPGNYTAIVTGAGGETGIGLVEIYEVP